MVTVGRVTTSVSISELQRFVDIDLLEKQIKQLQAVGRTEDERVCSTCLRESVETAAGRKH